MNKASAIGKPIYFRFYRILCIVLGSIIIVGISMLLLLLFTPGMKEILEGAGLTHAKLYILFATSVLFLIASIGLFKFKEAARIMIIIYSLWSLVESLYYYFLGFSSTPFISFANLLEIILFIIYVMIAVYFSKKDVRAYINA